MTNEPDPQWMQHYEIPARGGETLGDYKDWAFKLIVPLEQCNADQAAEREFYDAQ